MRGIAADSVSQLVEGVGNLPGVLDAEEQLGAAGLGVVEPHGLDAVRTERLLDPLVLALREARAEVTCCSRCGAFTVRSQNPCTFCTDATRDATSVCVVEEPADLLTIESSGAFRGRYHVLGGKLSPVRHLGPERLRIAELKDRVAREGFTEILLALSTDMEGDATAGYLAEVLREWPSAEAPVRLTRLAFGLPADSGVSYSDPLTLRRAIVHRCSVT